MKIIKMLLSLFDIMAGIAAEIIYSAAIMITAFKDDGETRRRILLAGVHAYFEKPISSFKELEDVVSKAIAEQ